MSKYHKLKQSNKLILATHHMNIQQLRLFYFVCSKYHGDLTVEVPIEELFKVLAYKSGGQRELLRKAIPTMMTSAIVHIQNDEGEGWSTVITNSFIMKDGKNVKFKFNESVKRELDEIEKYTWLYLENLTGMSSTYSIRLYEFFAMRLGANNQRETFNFELEYLKEYLDCKNKYSRFDLFDLRVLKQAKKEINEKSNIEMSYTKEKKGRSISNIVFTFGWKQKKDVIDVKHTVYDENEPPEGQTTIDDYLSENEEVLEMLKKYD